MALRAVLFSIGILLLLVCGGTVAVLGVVETWKHAKTLERLLLVAVIIGAALALGAALYGLALD